MLNWLKSLFKTPQPCGPPESIRQFRPPEPTLTRDGVTVAGEGWVIDSTGPQTVRLFQVEGASFEQCLLTFRAHLKTEDLGGRAFLEMWCRVPGRGEFFSKGVQQAVSGTTDWASYEVPFFLRRGQRADLVKLNVVIEGRGKVSIKGLELLKTPLSG